MADPNKLRNVPTFNPRPMTAAAAAPSEPRMMTVKAVIDTITDSSGATRESPRVVYDIQDTPIPHDRFVTTPLTASLVLAVMAGDLVELEPNPALARGLPSEYGGGLETKKPQEPAAKSARQPQARAE